jgi:DNA-binding NarL/FixJ family response regulator
MNKTRILLADNHPDLLETVEQHLEPEFEIVGKVGDGQTLLEEAMRLKPDVIVAGIGLPFVDGLEAGGRLKNSGCNSRIVFLTIRSDADFVRRCLSTGAFGYVLKPRISSELIPAILAALAGYSFISLQAGDTVGFLN